MKAGQRLEALIRKTPFLRLVRHFMERATGISSTSDFDFGIGGLLAVLALPGAFSSILLLDKYSSLLQFFRGQRNFDPYLKSMSDEYFFVVYSMAVMGLIVILRWDLLLPDNRDFANLGALPISLRNVFLANVFALAVLASIFALDINAVSMVVFPVLVTIQSQQARPFFEVMFAHTLSTLGIGAFSFLSIVSAQGILMAMLPATLYRKVALVLRTALLILLTATLISGLLLPMPFLHLEFAAQNGSSWWPPLWFLSVYTNHIKVLHGQGGPGSGMAVRALLIVGFLGVCGFSLSYRRYFLKIPEQLSASPRKKAAWLPFGRVSALFRPFVSPGLEAACFRFIFRSLLRSETHLLFAGLWCGIGLLLALESLHSAAGAHDSLKALLMLPLTVALFSIVGIRFVFDIASAPEANWAFRLIATESSGLVRSACRKVLLLVGLAPLALIWFPVAVQRAGWHTALIYFWLHALSVAILVEACLWRFHKMPFTCSTVPSRDRFLKMFTALLIVLVVVLPALGSIEASVTAHGFVLPLFVGCLMGILIWIYKNGAGEAKGLVYQDSGLDPFVLLRIESE